MKKTLLMLLIAIIGLPGCGGSHVKKAKNAKIAKNEAFEIDIPLADDNLRNFFDDEVSEFALLDQEDIIDIEVDEDPEDRPAENNEFAWAQEEDLGNYQVVYFDFDRYSLDKDQEKVVQQDIAYVKKELKKMAQDGIEPTVVVEGHACHSAGSAVYNLAISEKRAKTVANRFASEGLAVKTVGRGAEVPAVRNGKKITGNRSEQAKNRRAQVKILYS
jgi:outer membrane protein OmpA-like peptidoglycan-associated protein